jgi:hypothetical protein
MKLRVTIQMGNAAMLTFGDLALALEHLGQALAEFADPEVGDGGTIADVNGNTVGHWEVTRG